MFDEIYLESDEEVTSAIEKVKKSGKNNIALFLPRNSLLGQSIVNLKLLYKEASSVGKEIGLITPDPTARSLAVKIGFATFSSLDEVDFPADAKPAISPKRKMPPTPVPVVPPTPRTLKKVDSLPPRPVKPEVAPDPELDDMAIDDTDSAEAEDEDVPGEDSEDTSQPPSNKALASAGFTSSKVAHAEEEEPEASPKEEAEPDNHSEDAAPAPEPKASKPESKPVSTPADASASMIPTRGNLRFFRQKPRRRNVIMPLIIFLVVLLVGTGVAAVTIPSAVIKATLEAHSLTESVKSYVDLDAKAIDAEKSTIPGKEITVSTISKSSTKTTGKKDLGQKAAGSVSIVNTWDSVAHTFPAGTKLTAKNGNVYATNEDATVPGATSSVVAGKTTITPGQVDGVKVAAVDAGTAYNIGPSTFTIAGLSKAQEEKIYATSSAAFAGGTTNVVGVVTQSDIDKLTAAVKTQNHDELIAKIKDQSGENIIIDKAIQITTQEATPSAAVDTQSDTLEVAINGTAKVISFSKADQKQLLEKLLADKIPQGEKLVTEGEGVTTDVSQYELNLVSDKRLELNNNLKAFTVKSFGESDVKYNLIGINPKSVQSVLDKKLPIDHVDVTISPSWFPRMPFSGSKIKLQFAYKAKEEVKKETPKAQ